MVYTVDPVSIVFFDGAPNVIEGLAYSVTCEAFGIPEPSIVWSTSTEVDRFMIDTSTIDSFEGFTVKSVLSIDATVFSDTGVYNCTAFNTANGEDLPPVNESVGLFVTVLSKL